MQDEESHAVPDDTSSGIPVANEQLTELLKGHAAVKKSGSLFIDRPLPKRERGKVSALLESLWKRVAR